MTAPIKTCDFCNATGVMPTFMDGTTVCYDCLPKLPKTLKEAWREIVSLRKKIERMERAIEARVAGERLAPSMPSPDIYVSDTGRAWDAKLNPELRHSPNATPYWAQPSPSFADAYQGAMEDVAIWKKRALEAEDLNRKFVAEINGPAYTCEPTQPAASVPVEAIGKMLADAMAVAVSNGANSISMPDEYVEVAVWLRGISPQPTPARSA